MLRNILKPANARCSPRPCAIGERYQPPVGGLPFYAISAFLYAPRALDAVMPGGVLNVTKLRLHAWDYCNLTLMKAVNLTGGPAKFASNDCLMGLYIPLLLTEALGFEPSTNTITVTNDIDGNRIDWALGAMVQQLSMTFMDDLESKISCSQGDIPFPLRTEENSVNLQADLESSAPVLAAVSTGQIAACFLILLGLHCFV